MNIKPIEIDIEDKRLYAQIAFLVDSPTFIDRNIQSIRKRFKIESTFEADDFNSWENHILTLAGYNLEEYWTMDKVGSNAKNPDDNEWKRKIQWLRSTQANFLKKASIQKDFMESIVKLRKLHNYPPLFDSVIQQAVLFHRVTHFKTAVGTVSYDTLPISSNSDEAVMAIIVTPFSTQEDILSAFNEAKKLKHEYVFTNPLDEKLGKDTIPNIRRDREWYWQIFNGKRQHDIAVSENKGAAYYADVKKKMKFAGDLPDKQRAEYERYIEYIRNYTETIRKAVKRYEKELHRHLVSS